jgi:beta-aspartyl-peptidase (threonine type)
MVEPFIVGSDCAKGFLHVGAKVLRTGGSAMDAVEATIRVVESNPDEHSVGLGGIPNLIGIIQLDASIMDGRTMKVGSVRAISRETLYQRQQARNLSIIA